MSEFEWRTRLEGLYRAADDLPCGFGDRGVLRAHQPPGLALISACRLNFERPGREARKVGIDDHRAARPGQRIAKRCRAQIAGGRSISGFVLIAAGHDSNREAVCIERLEFLDSARRN